MFHLVHEIGAKLVSNWEQSMLYTKSYQVLLRKRVSMLTSLKVSSFACKCVFYRPELNAKWENHEIELWRSLEKEMKYING